MLLDHQCFNFFQQFAALCFDHGENQNITFLQSPQTQASYFACNLVCAFTGAVSFLKSHLILNHFISGANSATMSVSSKWDLFSSYKFKSLWWVTARLDFWLAFTMQETSQGVNILWNFNLIWIMGYTLPWLILFWQ